MAKSAGRSEFTKRKSSAGQRRGVRRIGIGVAAAATAAALVMVVNGDVLRAGIAAVIFGCVAVLFVRAME